MARQRIAESRSSSVKPAKRKRARGAAPFDCTIRFTGLCMFVANKPWDQSPERICTVVVNGRQDGTRALDGTRLRRHRGFVLFDVRNLPGYAGGAAHNQGVWYLEDQRVVLDTDGSPLDTTSYDAAIETNFNTKASTATDESLSWILSLPKLMPDFAGIDPDSVSIDETAAPVPGSVLAQVFFDKGTLGVQPPESQLWSFSGALSDQFSQQQFAHEVVLTLKDVTRVSLVATPLNRPNALADRLDLVPGKLGQVELMIANLCEENPLRWERSPRPTDDEDFKWYYELMTKKQRKAINRRRRGAPLPIPMPSRFAVSGNTTGVNCFGGRPTPIAFEMPKP